MMTATAIRNPQSAIRNSSRAAMFLTGGSGRASDGKLYPVIPEGVSAEIARDIAERRSRKTSAEVNSDHTCKRVMTQPVQRPVGPSIYEIFIKPRGLSEACATCDRHVEAPTPGNCPGRDPARDWELFRLPLGLSILPDCHGLHDGDREAVQAAMDERERLQTSDFRPQEQQTQRSREALAVPEA